jgi:hypothetical protein
VVLDDLSSGNRAAVPSNVPFIVGDVGEPDRQACSEISTLAFVNSLLCQFPIVVLVLGLGEPDRGGLADYRHRVTCVKGCLQKRRFEFQETL